ncbi:hypothetical protein HDV06_001830 [Boothiomyces sp. JEL0866]|nr:hypothetical protein HDV06_001830 [Boothiomyces sp. JEL0866]
METRKSNKRTKIVPISGSDWDQSTLKDLNIYVEDVDDFKNFFNRNIPKKFFNKNVEILLTIDLSLIKSSDDFVKICHKWKRNKQINKLLKYILLVYNKEDDEPIVDDMAKEFFDFIGFNENENLLIHGPKNVHMKMSSKKIYARPDICIENINNNILLLVQEDKSMFTGIDANNDAEAQLIAEMLSAYSSNINKKIASKHENAYEPQTIYGITLLGTYPTFYKFEINKDLIDHVSEGSVGYNDYYKCHKYSVGIKNVNFMFNEKQNIKKFIECLEALRIIIEEICPPSESDEEDT